MMARIGMAAAPEKAETLDRSTFRCPTSSGNHLSVTVTRPLQHVPVLQGNTIKTRPACLVNLRPDHLPWTISRFVAAASFTDKSFPHPQVLRPHS